MLRLLVEAARPGLLHSAGVVIMGGHMTTPREGLPRWDAIDDFNEGRMGTIAPEHA